MRTRLRLFLEWGITFEEPYIVPERADRAVAYANREDLERNLPQSNKAENADMRGAYAVSGRGGIAHEPAVDKPRRRGGKQMKTYGEEDLRVTSEQFTPTPNCPPERGQFICICVTVQTARENAGQESRRLRPTCDCHAPRSNGL